MGRKGPVIVSVIAIVAIVGALLLIGGAWMFGSVEPGESQQEVIDTFGPPAYFVVEYLAQDDAEQGPLSRVESWYYPEHQQAVHFIAGSAIAIDELDPDDAVYPYLDPRLFDFEMTVDQVVEALGEPAERIDDVLAPDEDGDGGEVYLSEHALFGVQEGYLLYIETFGDAMDSGGE